MLFKAEGVYLSAVYRIQGTGYEVKDARCKDRRLMAAQEDIL
jgi:hypothetical protein